MVTTRRAIKPNSLKAASSRGGGSEPSRMRKYVAVAARGLTLFGTAAAVALVAVGIGGRGFVTSALAEPSALTKAQVATRAAYDTALREFKEILAKRRAQIDAKEALPDLPGQAIYLARIRVMSTYKDLTRRAAIAHRAAQ